MRRVWWWSGGLGLVLAGVAFAHGGEDHGAPVPAPSAPAVHAPAKPGPLASGALEVVGAPILVPKESQFLFEVRTVVARPRELRGRVEVLGKLMPRADGAATIYPPQAGLLTSPPGGAVPLPGARVTKGELLAVVEGSLAAPERVGLAASKAEAGAKLAAAEARVAAAEREVSRLEGLSGVVSERDLASAKTELRIALAEAEGARRAAGITSAGGANRYELRAPLDGVIAAVSAIPGSQVSADRPLFSIVDARVLWAEARVFEEDLTKVQGVREARLRPEGLGDSLFAARLLSLGLLIDEQTRTVPILLEVDNPEGILRAGMFARVDLLAGENQRALVIPKEAVVRLGARSVVYVHTAPEQFEARAVTLGVEDGEEVAVLAGLREGDRVVRQGIAAVRLAGGR